MSRALSTLVTNNTEPDSQENPTTAQILCDWRAKIREGWEEKHLRSWRTRFGQSLRPCSQTWETPPCTSNVTLTSCLEPCLNRIKCEIWPEKPYPAEQTGDVLSKFAKRVRKGPSGGQLWERATLCFASSLRAGLPAVALPIDSSLLSAQQCLGPS